MSTRGTMTAAILFGIGLGGFADGVLLHQILQWHHMLSSVLPPTDMRAMEVNLRWDGFFHALVWAVTLAAAVLLWSAGRRGEPFSNGWWFFGWMLFGWGAFNFVEGLVNHHLLGLHHVRYQGDVYGAEPQLAWALGFVLIGGAGFMAAGWLMSRYGGGALQK